MFQPGFEEGGGGGGGRGGGRGGRKRFHDNDRGNGGGAKTNRGGNNRRGANGASVANDHHASSGGGNQFRDEPYRGGHGRRDNRGGRGIGNGADDGVDDVESVGTAMANTRIGRGPGPVFGFKRLHGFLESKGDEVILSIARDIEDWKEYLQSDVVLVSNQKNNLHLTMQILADKVVGESLLVNQQNEICVMALDPNFQLGIVEECTKISKTSFSSLQPIRRQPNNSMFTEIDKSPQTFLSHVLKYTQFALKRMPDVALDFLQNIVSMASGAANMKAMSDSSFNSLRDEFVAVVKELQEASKRIEERQKRLAPLDKRGYSRTEEQNEYDALGAPDDFKEIPIVPTGAELLSKEQPFLRRNKITGAYDDANHYLDVQFRLLREDFVRPLKNGIQDFLKHRYDYLTRKKKIPLGTIRIYTNVQIVSAQLVKDATVYKVQLIENNYKKIPWEKSKRLLTGSLLVFSRDLFQSIYFAVVASRNTDELKKGIVSIVWEGDGGPVWDTDDDYLMVECEVYFEAYRHTLQALKSLELQDFPMCKFVVEASSDVEPPKYLRDAESSLKIELKDGREKYFSPLLKDSWPSGDELGLDENQFNAFHAAITKEFAIVQGPPGTGKTFLGLKVVETLLANENLWQSAEGTGPILVVCYTNHALDQFLEGILDGWLNTHGKAEVPIVRVGGRSQSESLQHYSLANVSRRKCRTLPKHFWGNKKDILDSIDSYRNQRSATMDALSALRNLQGVIDFSRLDAWKNLMIDYPSILWKFLQLPSWLGMVDDNFKSRYFNPEAIIRKYFRIREVGGYRIKKTLTFTNKDQGAKGQDQNKGGDNANVEDGAKESDDEEDYDVDELLSERLIDEVYAEVESKQTAYHVRLPYLHQFSVDDCEKAIKVIQKNIPRLRQGQKPIGDQVNKVTIDKLEEEAVILGNRKKFLEQLFSYYNADLLELPDVSGIMEQIRTSLLDDADFQRCTMSVRWAIYFFMVSQARKKTAEIVAENGKELVKSQKKLQELQRFGDGWILQNSKIVGMTTTGAAKYNDLVQMMRSKIVVIEEAAEVLEAHIVTCITRHCQHLILIGDHRQLRPSTTVYELATNFNLDISLFERMIKNNLNCYQLKTQHRMRPEIADLVVGTVYEELYNYATVYRYPPVKGISKNLFFISHKELEKSESDSTSKSNVFEAKYLAALCRHLVLQGYETNQITVLTAYVGQMFLLKKTISEFPNCKGVKVTCVDNFQGEENDIILLSLVRSNTENKVGFLNIDNRVCVSLSRAKHGLFIIGNMEMLSSKCKIWFQIHEKLMLRNEIGDSLQLECQIHGTQVKVQTETDFRQKSPQGGCTLNCDYRLPCGHNCTSLCHVKDREHKEYQCKLPCTKHCVNQHLCSASCFRKCPPCPTSMTKTLPQCGHLIDMACHKDPSTYVCVVPVKKKLPCGHEKELACHINPEEVICKEKVRRNLRCGHERTMECHEDVLMMTCKIIVEKELPCGHKQDAECRFLPDVIKCQSTVIKRLAACGHTMEVKCHDKDKSIACKNVCSIRLNCGHQCTKICHVNEDPQHRFYTCRKDCTKVCEDPLGHKCQGKHKCFEKCPPCEVETSRSLPCGHTKLLSCYLDVAEYECLEPCDRIMTCMHECQNLCFQNCGPCHALVKKMDHVCGHVIEIECSRPLQHELCKQLVMPKTLSACGHLSRIPCGISVTATAKQRLEVCSEPCKEVFQEEVGGCGHGCKGTCGSCSQGRFHEKCKEKCGRTLVCGHICAFPCAKSCPPCDRDCPMRCEHSECNKKCGTPCLDCSEPCPWKCVHLECKKLCKEECDRLACEEPCTKMLKCGHLCIGFCGEECPIHCRVCDKEHLTEFFLYGNEGDDDARFIYLPDCKHSIEVEGLTYHMQLDDQEIGMKKCPRCQTVITRCRRFNNVIRKRLQDVLKVKKTVFGNEKQVQNKQKEIVKQLKWDENDDWRRNFPGLYEYLINNVADLVPAKDKKGTLWLNKQVNLGTISSIQFLLELGKNGIKILLESRNPEGLTTDLQKTLHEKYRSLFSKIMTHQLPLSPIELRDIGYEMDRLYDTYQIYLRRSKPQFTNGHAKAVPIYENLLLIVEACTPYTDANKKMLRTVLLELEAVLKTGLGISNAERIEILKAFDMRQGHWFKCPNGHIYVITECGGAMQESICNECGATIGGGSHALRRDNQLASEMDGAVAPLWPNTLQ